MAHSSPESLVANVRAAGERLSERLRFRSAERTDPRGARVSVPLWWREGLAECQIFGEGMLSWPGDSRADEFSRAVTLFDSSEISVSAGGDFLPFAWLDGGVEVAVVAARPSAIVDGAPGPVLCGPPDGGRAAEPMSESLIVFLDRLQPQTLCLLAGPAGRRRIELCGERTLRIERSGRVYTQDFASDDEVGLHVGKFLSQSIDDGLRVVSCPARMRPLVARYSGQVAQARNIAPEVRAQRVVENLLRDELLELREQVDVEDLIDECARFIERESPMFRPSGRPSDKFARRFTEWLLNHAAVEDVYADDEQLVAAFEL